jgi:Tfp pilus assembly protein PilW
VSASTPERGLGVVELLVGVALSFVSLAALTATVATGGRLLATAGARGEAEDTAQLALEAFAFDVRRAGFDPAGITVAPLSEARADRLTLDADLDGDGAVDVDSEERTAYVCATGPARLSRLIGRQSLPLADGLTACGFRYLDGSGAELPVAAGPLAAADRARVRAVAIDLALRPTTLRTSTVRTLAVALRTRQ